MERTIRLLREKNHYLENFFEMNERELVNFEAGRFENVEPFYRSRGKILDIIRSIDEKVSIENGITADREATLEDRAAIEGAFNAKESWVAAILAQDLRIISRIDTEKSNIIRELQSTQKTRKAIGAYSSNF